MTAKTPGPRICGMCGRRIRSSEPISYRVTTVTPNDVTYRGRLYCWFCADCFGGTEDAAS